MPDVWSLPPLARYGMRWSWSPPCPWVSPDACAGCPVSGKAAIASSWVGWSACTPCPQGGQPWQHCPAGPRRPAPRGVAAAWGRRAMGRGRCCGSGGAQQRSTPCHRPRMAPAFSWGTAVSTRSGAHSLPWPNKDVQGQSTRGVAGGVVLCGSSTGMARASQALGVCADRTALQPIHWSMRGFVRGADAGCRPPGPSASLARAPPPRALRTRERGGGSATPTLRFVGGAWGAPWPGRGRRSRRRRSQTW